MHHPFYGYIGRLERTEDVPLLSRTWPLISHTGHPIWVPLKPASELPIGWGGQPRQDPAGATPELRRYLQEGRAQMAVLGYGDPFLLPQTGWTDAKRHVFGNPQVWPWLYRTGYHAASWFYDSTFSVSVEPVYGLDIIETDDNRGKVSRFAGGARFEGGYDRWIHFMVDFRDYTEAREGAYLSRSELYEDRWAHVALEGTSANYNISESFIRIYRRDLSLMAGRGRHRWGPAQFGSLMLNSQMPPFDYLRFDGLVESRDQNRALFYTFLHGSLESMLGDSLYILPNGRPRTINAQKYLSAQRLELRVRRNLMLAFSQAVTYGDRGVQLPYLTPLNFLYSVQHSTNDQDNLLISFDGNWRPVRGVSLYGEVLFDDITVGRLFSSSGDNKNAWTVGGQAGYPHGWWRNLDLTVEYTRIRPLVYSHFFKVNPYTHWTSGIGYSREPNSEYMTAELRATFWPVQLTLHASRHNHGANPVVDGQVVNVGGDIFTPAPEDQSADFPFLAGRLERTDRLGIRADWEVLPKLMLFGQGFAIEMTGAASRFEWLAGFGWNL